MTAGMLKLCLAGVLHYCEAGVLSAPLAGKPAGHHGACNLQLHAGSHNPRLKCVPQRKLALGCSIRIRVQPIIPHGCGTAPAARLKFPRCCWAFAFVVLQAGLPCCHRHHYPGAMQPACQPMRRSGARLPCHSAAHPAGSGGTLVASLAQSAGSLLHLLDARLEMGRAGLQAFGEIRNGNNGKETQVVYRYCTGTGLGEATAAEKGWMSALAWVGQTAAPTLRHATRVWPNEGPSVSLPWGGSMG